MHAVVPAAGEGTRLRPLTEDQPKALVPVAGRPLLAHVFDACLDAGATSLVVVVGYRGDAIREYVGASYRGAPVEYVEQRQRRGLGHAVGLAGPRVDDAALVVNGDNVLGGSLAPLVARHDRGEAAATLLVEDVDRETARETGVCAFDGDRLVGVVEKPDDPPSTTVLAGALVATPALFAACRDVEPSPRGEVELPRALSALLDAGERVDLVRYDGERVNVNREADLARAADLVDPA
jgi:dTDP-glucose pyrophosphorylase